MKNYYEAYDERYKAVHEKNLRCMGYESSPIVSEGNPAGGVMVLSSEAVSPDETAKKLVNTGAMFLSSQMQV